MAHGIVTNWFDMELIFNHVYSELNCLSEQHPVLLTQAPLNSKKNRDVSAQLFFETYNVPALFFSVQAVLALYASGKTTGIVLDIGDGVSHSVPVYQGFAVSHAIQRLDLAGRNITSHLQLLLRKSGYCLDTSAEFDIVRQIKEKSCYLSSNPQKEEQDFQKDSYILPDGNIIKLGSERFLAPEILFQPHLIGCEHLGVHQLLVDCINRVDMDIRKSMFTNIVLSGGTTLTKGICSNLGFGDRLLKETKKLAQRDIKIKIHAPPERTYSTWVGGSILASLSIFL
jgi:centractin